MIVEQITELPTATWSHAAEVEIKNAVADPALIVKFSDRVWALKRDDEILAVAGVLVGSLCGSGPELWLLLTDAFECRSTVNLRALHMLIPHLLTLYPYLRIKVRKDFTVGLKFALHFGFNVVHQEQNYTVLECHSAL